MPTFSIKTAFKTSWQIYRQNLGFFILLTLLTLGLRLTPAYLINQLTQPSLITITSLLNWLLDMIITLGLINISLNFITTNTGNLHQLYSKIHLLGKYILGFILYGLIVLLGFILFIIPGIIWSIKYQFFGYLIIDKRLGPKQALKASSLLTQGKKLKLFGLLLLLLLLNLIAALPLFLGLIITIPLTGLVMAHVYRQLKPPATPSTP